MNVATQCSRASCDQMLSYKPPRIALLLLTVAIASHAVLPVCTSTSSALVTTGLTTVGAGFVILLRAWWLFRKRTINICPTAHTRLLIVDDIFALTRNPMYLGMVAIMTGIGMTLASWPVFIAGVVYALIINHVFCRYEEAKLQSVFGETYSAYKDHVRRWI